jgi:metal-responsive CopG/Arc/MetJ family transcriptional regulator
MSSAKVAISIEQGLLRKLDLLVERDVFRSRSEAIQTAVREKISRIERSRLAGECAKLDPVEEQCLADQGLANDLLEWPDY